MEPGLANLVEFFKVGVVGMRGVVEVRHPRKGLMLTSPWGLMVIVTAPQRLVL